MVFIQSGASSPDALTKKSDTDSVSSKADLTPSKVKCTNKQENINGNCLTNSSNKKQSAEAIISWSSLPATLLKPGKVYSLIRGIIMMHMSIFVIEQYFFCLPCISSMYVSTLYHQFQNSSKYSSAEMQFILLIVSLQGNG